MASNIDTTLPIHGSAFDDVRKELGVARDEITALQALVPPGGVYSVDYVQFTFATPSPMVLQALAAGQQIDRARIVVTTMFDDPTARIQLGTAGSPSLFFDLSPIGVGQFADDNILDVAAPEFLRFLVSPGLSTQGAGFIFYSVRG